MLTTQDINEQINVLKTSQILAERIESLIFLKEVIEDETKKENQIIKQCANQLISAYSYILKDVFERPVADFPLRFAKFFVGVFEASCECKEVMKEVKYQQLYELLEQLLPTLLNLEKLKEQKAGKEALTHLHNALVNCIENCESSLVYTSLFDLLRRYKDQKIQLKLPDLILNCITLLNRS